HLGGINAIQRQNGTLEQMRYAPFGAYRQGGPNAITDRAYTGQRESMDLGLYYYNARYYLPGLGRFLSADTIVPDPQNPQSLNRYSYVLNRPLNLIDSTGHNPNFPMIDNVCASADACIGVLFRGQTGIVSLQPTGRLPEGWRRIKINYQTKFGAVASDSALGRDVYIQYQVEVDDVSQLLGFEVVARVMLGENQRGLLFEDPRFASEVEEHWPQDQIAVAYIAARNAKRSGESMAEHAHPNNTANPMLNPPNAPAADWAHIIALGTDQAWLQDPTLGADWYFHKNKNPPGNVLDDTFVGDYAAGTWWQPTFDSTRVIYPFGIRSSECSPYSCQ
ncbi:MAG TPA: RHS repeat-associated core domain-containing protein, partial [Chromatiaceae bacterium]|nr:RHS repeat-associated core domain-containing protein [Chromatiaceae bacterium]